MQTRMKYIREKIEDAIVTEGFRECSALVEKLERYSRIDDELSASGFAKLPATPEWILEIESK